MVIDTVSDELWIEVSDIVQETGIKTIPVERKCKKLSDPMDCSLPGSPVPGILQARTLEWVAISFSNA